MEIDLFIFYSVDRERSLGQCMFGYLIYHREMTLVDGSSGMINRDEGTTCQFLSIRRVPPRHDI